MDLSRDNYTTPLPYIISRLITEYDISKANANILLYKEVIDKNEYDYILSLDRARRQIYVGLKEQDPEVAKTLQEGFAEFRTKFVEANGLSEANIVSIKKDAIFVLDNKCRYTKFDNIEFKEKNVYTSYLRIFNLEIFYYLDIISNMETIDIKGIDDNKLPAHQDYMLTFLCIMIEMLQSHAVKDVVEYIYKFSEKYKNRELDLGYYREFNADSQFRITVNGCNYLTDFLIDSEVPMINISTNYKFIMELYKIISNIYYQNK